nr:hypothetical protein [Sandaracinus sp.]
MSSIRARVRGGRLVVDAPTDLPEGLEVTLAIVDDDLDEESRTALESSLEESHAELERGELLDAADVLSGLRSLRSVGR